MARLRDGFSTLITLSGAPTIKLFEKEVTPPGFSSGGGIDITSMRNTAWRTMAPRKLKTLSPISATVAFDSDAIPAINGQINVNQLITVTFPDGSKLQFFGFVSEFTPGRFAEGEEPTATITIQPTLINASGQETAPTYLPPSSS
jgi:hypothetical protein